MLTFVVYGVLNYKQYKLLMSRPPSPFTILGDSATTAVTATPVETKER
jgi:hypothetical protein